MWAKIDDKGFDMGNEGTDDDDDSVYKNCTSTCPNQIVTPVTTTICGKTCDAQTKLDGQHPGQSHHCPRCGNW
jgi:hypothetical protein